jgi:hypothetical protein
MTQFTPTNRNKTPYLKQKNCNNLCRPKTLDFGCWKNQKEERMKRTKGWLAEKKEEKEDKEERLLSLPHGWSRPLPPPPPPPAPSRLNRVLLIFLWFLVFLMGFSLVFLFDGSGFFFGFSDGSC